MVKTKPSQKFDLVSSTGNDPLGSQTMRKWTHTVISSDVSEHFAPHGATTVGDADDQLNHLLEAAGIVVWEADAETFEFNFVSEEAVKLVGFKTDQWYEPDFLASHIHPDDLERVFAHRWSRQLGQSLDFEFRMLATQQNTVWIRTLAEVVEQGDEHLRMRGFMIDITDRKRAEETLRELGGRLISAQEEERSRVARELHDDVNQRMAVLSIQLEQLQQDLEMSLDLSLRYKNVKAQVQEISNDIHRLSYRLHPSKLDHLGLGAAVESLCAELGENAQIQIEFHKSRVPANLPPDITLCVFRIAQEALRNCIKHSGARAVEVMLEKRKNDIHLSVTDNGCGFDQDSALIRKGLGFISMRERLRLVDGCVQIHTKPLWGTRIEVLVPLKQEAKRRDLEELLPRKENRVTEAKSLLRDVRFSQVEGGNYESHTRDTCG